MEIKPRPKVVAMDLDGTILGNSFPELSPPLPGVVDELQALKAAGWVIVIWTVRNDSPELRAHLKAHKVPYDYINENPNGPKNASPKIFADVYVDDRGLAFNGDAKGLASRVMGHKEWHKSPPLELTE